MTISERGCYMRVNITSNIEQVIKGLEEFNSKDLPYVMRTTVNNIVFDALESLKNEARGNLNLKNARTASTWRVKKATKQQPYAEIYMDEFSWQYKVLAHHYKGGDRERKGMEKAMAHMGIMRKHEILTPSPGVKIRSYVYTQMMAQLKLNYKAGYSANETKASRQRREKSQGAGVRYFVVTERSKSHMTPGVYARMPGHDKPICLLRISARPTYKKRMDMETTVSKVIARRQEKHFSNAVALATAFRKSKGW